MNHLGLIYTGILVSLRFLKRVAYSIVALKTLKCSDATNRVLDSSRQKIMKLKKIIVFYDNSLTNRFVVKNTYFLKIK